jgi:hypothetical protein
LGAGKNYKLLTPLVQKLIEKQVLSLYDTDIGSPQPRGRSGWKDESMLGLNGDMATEWNSYIGLMCENHILLDNEIEDSLCWSKNHKGGSFTVKLGYKSWQEFNLVGGKYGGGTGCGN